MYLRAKYENLEIPPSYEILLIWHKHIHHTANYRNFCEQFFKFGFLDCSYCDSQYTSNVSSEIINKFVSITQKVWFAEFHEEICFKKHINLYRRLFLALFGKIPNISFSWISSGIAASFISIFYMIINSHNHMIDDKYEQLKNIVNNLTLNLEDVSIYCNSDGRNENEVMNNIVKYGIIKSIRSNLDNFSITINGLHDDSYVNDEIFNETVAYASLLNDMYISAFDFCAYKPKQSIDEMDKEKRKLLSKIWDSRLQFYWPW